MATWIPHCGGAQWLIIPSILHLDSRHISHVNTRRQIAVLRTRAWDVLAYPEKSDESESESEADQSDIGADMLQLQDDVSKEATKACHH